RQVLGVGQPGAIDRLAHGHPQARRGDPRREPVDRHDPAGMKEIALGVLTLELRVVEDHGKAALLEPTADHQTIAGGDPPLDVAPAEPDRLGLAGLVADEGDGPLDPPPEALLDADGADRDPGA